MIKPDFKHLARTVALLAVMGASGPVFAHADVVATVPAVDSAAAASTVTELRISFSEPFELAFTKVSVTGDQGEKIGLGTLSVDPADPKTLVIPLESPLPQGVATIQWSTVAADSHKSNGTYQIRITP
jgi:methionine-rich copper-binding protein CopC